MDKDKAKDIVRRNKEREAKVESERHTKRLSAEQVREEAKRLEQMRKDARRGKR